MEQNAKARGSLLCLLFALAAALAMAACLLPGTVQKAYADVVHTHNGVTFVEWTDALAQEQNGSSSTAATSLPSKEGSYYLTDRKSVV